MYLKIFFFIFLWYFYMSFCDWYIHKHILHNDNNYFNFLKKWREDHKIHHLENDDKLEKLGIGSGFNYYEAISITLITSIPLVIILFLYLIIIEKINISHKIFIILILIFIFHIILTIIGIGIHNFSHSIFHSINSQEYYKIPIPKELYIKLHKHHNDHHKNCKKNFCTVFLGFDNIL
jgi:hypothetical protein